MEKSTQAAASSNLLWIYEFKLSKIKINAIALLIRAFFLTACVVT